MMHTQKHAEDSFAASRRAFRRPAFTLIELLVVIGIIVVLFTVAVPGVRNMLNSGHIDQTLNLLGAATASARSYTGLTPPFATGQYQGVALVITPSNELRFTQNTDKAVDTTGDPINTVPRHGYVDIGGREYVQLPRRVGIVGIGRPDVTGGTGLPLLLAPPFAIRFNNDGALMARTAADQCVYYNGNYNYHNVATNGYSKPIIVATRARNNPWDGASEYNPDLWNANSSIYVASRNTDQTKPGVFFDSGNQAHPDNGKLKLPFERLETVVGVIIFDREEFDAQGFSDGLTAEQVTYNGTQTAYPVNAVARQWILENGEPMFFNRYNGSRIRP